jgi:hypothetical protein
MAIESYLMAEMLQRLETQGTMLRSHAVEIATSLSRDEYPEALKASAELLRALNVFVNTTAILRGHVVAHDGMGDVGGALGELTLRARTLVVVDQLAVLRDALRDPVIDELVAFVRERIAQIHATWRPYRHDQAQSQGMTEPDRSCLYRTMIRVAHRALSQLRDEPKLSRTLDRGIATTNVPEIHQPCQRIDVVLAWQFDGEGGRPMSSRLRRSRPPNGVPELP